MRKTCIVLCTAVLLVAQTAFSLPAKFGLAPDNNLGLLLSTINSAKKTLTINIYQFDEPVIADALMSQIKAGITLQLLLEGEPLGTISPSGKIVIDRIRKALSTASNKKSKFFLMTSTGGKGSARRYRYNHAKYVIADNTTVLISSENFTPHGHPKPGQLGNRGWTTVLDDPALAEDLNGIFQTDSDTRYGDVDVITLSTEIPGLSPMVMAAVDEPRAVGATPIGAGDVRSAALITSPNALDGLVDLIRSARRDIAVEEMSLPSTWRDENYDKQLSPIIKELVRAAKRGVKVRVLLNDEAVFSHGQPVDTSTKPNTLTVKLLNDYARCYDLPTEGRIVDVKAVGISYIHNKGILVDGTKALVSSINGTKNSVMNNREIAVLLESPDAARYFTQSFDFDWTKSSRNRFISSEPCPIIP